MPPSGNGIAGTSHDGETHGYQWLSTKRWRVASDGRRVAEPSTERRGPLPRAEAAHRPRHRMSCYLVVRSPFSSMMSKVTVIPLILRARLTRASALVKQALVPSG